MQSPTAVDSHCHSFFYVICSPGCDLGKGWPPLLERVLRALLSKAGLPWAVTPHRGVIVVLNSLAPWTPGAPMSLVMAVCSQQTIYFIPSLPTSLDYWSHAF